MNILITRKIKIVYYIIMSKTLIGKNGYLFLINDSSQELKIHCDNIDLVNTIELINVMILLKPQY
jgi:hypothetical protein